MGTRSAVIMIEKKEAKGYYNQYDGYPDGLGEEVIEELIAIDKVKDGWKTFKKNVAKVKLVDEDKKPAKTVQEKYKKFFNNNVSTGSPEEWYALLRELQGAKYIPAIMTGEVEHMCDGTEFVKFSLFCEYAYVIDLDRMVMEFYKGFQTKSQKGNRFGTKKAEGEDTYFPCAKIGEIALEGISKDELAIKTMMDAYERANAERELQENN